MTIDEMIYVLKGFRGQYGDIEVLVDVDLRLDTPCPHVAKTNTGGRVVVL